MLAYQDRLQGTDRLLRIRRIRKAAFAGLLALTVVLIAARLGSEGASLKPFFLPVNGIIEVSLIMGLVATFVGLYLRDLEIKNAQRDSQRYLMAKYSMTRAFRTAGFTLGIAVVLLLAVTPSVAAALFSDSPRIVPLLKNGQEVVTFTSPDPFGVTFVTHAVVTVTSGQASVTVLRNNMTVTSQILAATQRFSFDIEPTMWAALANWSLVFRNLANGDTYVRFELQKGLMPTLFSTVPFLLFLYGAAQLGWWVGLRPIRERTKASSLSVAPSLESGERVYDPNAMPSPNPGPQSETAFNFTAAPPPPPRAPPPAPPVPVAVAGPVVHAEPPRPVPRPPVRQPETPASLVMKGDALASANAHEAALGLYDESVRLDPTFVPAILGRATTLARLNRRPEAIETYKQLLSKDAKNLDALRGLGRMLADDRRWRECLEAVDGLLRARPNEAPALEMRGDAIASANGNYPAALNLFDDILEVDPSNVNALIGKAVAYRRSGKPQEALNCLDLVLGVQANNASALLNRGNILLEEGDLEGALDAFDRLTQLYPNDEEAWAAQGEVLGKMGRDDDAMRAYTEALKLSPGDEGIQRHILELEAARTAPTAVLNELRKIKGVGQARAKALVDAGFTTPDAFAKANAKDLMTVRGITRKIAEDLVDHFKAAIAEMASR